MISKKTLSTLIPLVFIFNACLMIISCNENEIIIIEKELGIANVLIKKKHREVTRDLFLKFSFKTSIAISDPKTLKTTTQVRAVIYKEDKILNKDIASSTFLLVNDRQKSKSGNYTALLFKSISNKNLAINHQLNILDFDRIEIIVVNPMMGLGIKSKSGVISFSQSDVIKALSKKPENIVIEI
jgi:hypothetical protein